MILWCKPNTDPLIEQENDEMMILWCKSNKDPFIEQENDEMAYELILILVFMTTKI